jgi:SAM-dependent methyltransferase
MNLFDIIKRKDRALSILDGEVQPRQQGGRDAFLGARLGPSAHIRLARADEFAVFRTFPREIGWRLRPPIEAVETSLTIEVADADASCRSPLFVWNGMSSKQHEIRLDWPVWVGRSTSFSIELRNGGNAAIEIESSPLFATRDALKPLIRGVGVEIGPGMRPFVRPGPDVEVRFVEATPVAEWKSNYGKAVDPAGFDQSLWDHYVIGDGHELECCDDDSLDFIFSSHVFEHLMNPLGVLENWSRKLRSGGVVLAVIPDYRYCFDLRQRPSSRKEWLQEHDSGGWRPPWEKYEKWCKYTAPYNTPQSLIERNYSIHVHYYTPDSFLELAKLAIECGIFGRIFLNTSPNNKDFGVVLWKD